jgi:predicted transcriptional regulator YheO
MENTQQLLQRFCAFLSQTLGEETEVVLHDDTGRILWIANGHLTGREAGMQEQKDSMDLLAKQALAQQTDFCTGYKSFSRQGKPLKSSSFFVRGEDGEVKYILCVNQDISTYVALRDQMSRLIGEATMFQAPNPGTDSLNDVIMKMILEEMERSKPFDMDSREEKLRLIERLNSRGVFAARGATATVCELLHIAQPTLYKYLQKIK